MIKINLVPVKEKKKRKEFFYIFWAVVFFISVGFSLFYIYVKKLAVVNDLNRQIEEVQKESAGYQDKINEIKDLQAKKDSLDAIKKTIQGISEIQRKVLAAVDQSAANLPDGVWLTRLAQSSGNDANKFTLQGYATSMEQMKSYVSNLQRPGGLLKEVTFDEKTYSTSASNTILYQFEISFRVLDQGT